MGAPSPRMCVEWEFESWLSQLPSVKTIVALTLAHVINVTQCESQRQERKSIIVQLHNNCPRALNDNFHNRITPTQRHSPHPPQNLRRNKENDVLIIPYFPIECAFKSDKLDFLVYNLPWCSACEVLKTTNKYEKNNHIHWNENRL